MKEWLYRAVRTFFQAAAGYVAANLLMVVTNVDTSDFDALKMALCGLVTSALAAGIAALMNNSSKPKGEPDNEDNP